MSDEKFEQWRRTFEEFKDELFQQIVRLNTCYEEKTVPEIKLLRLGLEEMKRKCDEISRDHLSCSIRTGQTLERVARIQQGCFHCNHPEDAITLRDRIGTVKTNTERELSALKTSTAVLTEKSKWYWMGLGVLGGAIPVIVTIGVGIIVHFMK